MTTADDAPNGKGARVAVFVGAAIALLSLCCCVGLIVSAATWGDDLYHRVTRERGDTVRMGTAGRDGEFEFTVVRLDCGVAQIGDSFVSQTAVGQFCLAEMTVQNVGTKPATFTDTLQRAYGPDGVRFGADSAAGILANSDQQVFLNEINPGNQVTAVVVYDIPPDSRILKLELHESASTPGLTVNV
ncbi:DUF4352 domain-containing protein [Phytohabitans rumicis]|uniref:DUF4352 domain-containing protein n=1 Tax=Phytohabitans rumicis TaxID=1076125 RepID=A0A6V8L896_9ACTN|nr:DUF4352 domain-containing protein [Phytohabitans rumicis]GFJ90227.1 hypothetical protein Prum_038690 [Phytohabitans rumicis]